MARCLHGGAGSSRSRGEGVGVEGVPAQLQPAGSSGRARADAADAVDRAEHVGLRRAARSGSRACTSRRCRPRAGCRRRPRARRSGGSRGCRRRGSRSRRVVKVAPVGLEDVPGDLLQVEAGRRRGCRGTPVPKALRLVARQPAGGGGAEVGRGPASGRARSAGGPSSDVVDLAVDAAVDRVDQAVALAAAGCWRKVVVKIRSPPGVKTTSTGLSMPPVITGSMPAAVGPGAEDVRGA